MEYNIFFGNRFVISHACLKITLFHPENINKQFTVDDVGVLLLNCSQEPRTKIRHRRIKNVYLFSGFRGHII